MSTAYSKVFSCNSDTYHVCNPLCVDKDGIIKDDSIDLLQGTICRDSTDTLQSLHVFAPKLSLFVMFANGDRGSITLRTGVYSPADFKD